MAPIPQVGEVWFVDFGYDEKPRYALVVASSKNGRLLSGQCCQNNHSVCEYAV